MPLRLSSTILVFALATLSAGAFAQAVPPDANCTAIPGTEPMLQDGRVVMVGEVHGTNEMPSEFLRLVCSALQRGQPVVVGLEMFDPQGTLAAYMASSGDAAARQALLGARDWNGMRDGRSSVAALGMIETFRTWRLRGLPLSVFALNDTPFSGGYDQVMATRLRQERTGHPDALILTYTGNVHSMLKRQAGLPTPMGMLLADLDPVSIGLTSDGGQAWVCMGASECGAQDWSATPQNGPLHAARPAVQAAVYSLQLNVGRVTASPPAVPPAH